MRKNPLELKGLAFLCQNTCQNEVGDGGADQLKVMDGRF
jgi:hypothetical protein